jgi:plastocyanin
MRKLGIAKRVGAVLLSLLAAWSMVAAASGTVITSVSAQSTSSGPSTWHVLVGDQSKDQALQAEGYYPRVITIDAGDTVVWTLNTGEIHSVTFNGTCADISCVPPCFFTVNYDISPCGSPTYDGVSAIASSGRMVPAGYNWNNAFPHGDTTYALTFTHTGVNVYFDLSASGMRGVVIVHPAGTPYPFTQAQYSQQAQDQVQADLAVGASARDDFQPVAPSTNSDGTHLHHVALGTSPPERARVDLGSVKGSDAHGSAPL